MSAQYSETGIGFDCSFDLTEFDQPKICSEIETIKNALLFVLFSKPGQYPSIPHIGLGIDDLLYADYEDLDEEELKNDIIEQCNALGAYIQEDIIAIKKMEYMDKPALLIHIEGTEQYPPGYKVDTPSNSNKYMIGITLNELNKLIYNVN